eukprot:7413929-Prorocentrum_lima.AAC.1
MQHGKKLNRLLPLSTLPAALSPDFVGLHRDLRHAFSHALMAALSPEFVGLHRDMRNPGEK